MSQPRLAQWGPPIAATTGMLWWATAIGSRVSPDSDDWDCNSAADYVTNTLGAAAFLLMAVAVLVLYRWQRDRTGTLGKVGFVMTFVGALAAGINNPIEHCASVGAMGSVVWVPAVLLLLGGLITLGTATIRAKVLPLWTGGALIVGSLSVGIAAESGGWLVLGCAWLLVSVALWSARHQPTPPTA